MIHKSHLKKENYYEFKTFYDDLPDKLPVPKFSEKKYEGWITEKELSSNGFFSQEEAFGLVASLISEGKATTDWMLVFFKDANGLACELRFGLDSGGELYADVNEVREARGWYSPRVGFPLCNPSETKDETLTLCFYDP